ncbi:outer membrane protein [Mariluticola halotolerans]|uniref:outer membrane protein n=1 Tax=Mariluticola halotolerans TaxID=2909283 RepID=UPI0026E1FE02|nr:outer membrane beta-barrel protein [Mariluticola halotolerans]UJQ94064.1 outer membrane beta-barrel protein [Mariluticola halotolerans]
MRKLKAVVMLAVAALLAAPAYAADYPQYPPIDIPDLPPVDYGLAGSFYLRGSVGGNGWWAKDAVYCNCAVTTFDTPGYGYSLGVGVGYETGDGLRADVTIDYLSNGGLTTANGYKVNLRSGLALANIYYDIPLDGGYSAEGGFGLYVGAGLGVAKNYSEVMNGSSQYAWGHSLEGAAALMAGVSYDMGNMVADFGYRGIYMNKVMSQPANLGNAYLISDNFIHEVRGTMRYRFN